MIKVELLGYNFNIDFSHTNDFGQNRKYDGFIIDRTSQRRVYCTATKSGIKYTTIMKTMQFDNSENVYLKFGKNKVVIGSYKEVTLCTESIL